MYKNFFKRIIDFTIVFIVLLIIWPILLLITIWLHFANKGAGAFFTQERPGKDGKIFKVIKFKSMTDERDENGKLLPNEKRLTKIGSIIRKTSIDELPQLINVLKGDMSLIGPRPERPELAIELEKEIPFYKQRLLVKPGITGWDQVSGEYHSPSIEDTYKKIQYDLYYIKNQSIFLEISIFFKTIMTVFLKLGR